MGTPFDYAPASTPFTGAEAWYCAQGGLDVRATSGAMFSSPPALGNILPNSGAFTTLSASGIVSGAGMDTYTAARIAAGLPGSFTTLHTTGLIAAPIPSPAWASYSTQYNGAFYNIGSFPLTSLIFQNTSGTVSTLTGAVDTPSTDTVWSGGINAGVSGYARSASTTKGSVGIFGAGMSNANGTSQWGANFIATNFSAPSGTNTGQKAFTTIGCEIDVYLNGTSLTGLVEGLKIVGACSMAPTGGAYGIEIAPLNVAGTLGWGAAIAIDDAPNTSAINIGVLGAGSTLGSQALRFAGRTSAGARTSSSISVDAPGNLVLTPYTGAVIIPGAIEVTDLYTSDTAYLHITTATLANGAGSSTATLTNSPVVGNPTKWIAIADNGTVRRIPTWG